MCISRSLLSEEQLKSFLKKLDCDKDFREKIRSAADTDEIAQIAQQHGFAIDKKDLLSMSDTSGTEISEAELEEMAAGCWTVSAVYNFFHSQGQFYKTCHQHGGVIANKAMTTSFFFDDCFQLRTHIILATEGLLVSPITRT